MRLPQLAPPDSMTESEVAKTMLPRDRTSAVTALFEEHYVGLMRMARLLVDDRETAEDVVMDAFTSPYRRWTAVRDPGEAHRYLRSCVLNGARSQLRRRRLRRRHESTNLQQEAARDSHETNEADRRTVTQLLATLPYRQRQVLVLRYFVDLTQAQIAYELGVSPGSVKTTPRAASPPWPEHWKVRNDTPRRRRRPGSPVPSVGGDQRHARRYSPRGRAPTAPHCRHPQTPASHIADIRRRRRVTLAVAASVVTAVAVAVAGGSLGVKNAEPAQNPDQSVRVAREFVDAIGRFDAVTAISYLTKDADVQGNHIVEGSDAAEQLRLTLAHDRVLGYKQTIKDCVRVGITVPGWMVPGDSISCAFDMQAYRSDEIGLNPYTDNVWRITIGDGKIVWAQQDMPDGTNGFDDQMWIPFGIWMQEYHPDDVLTVYTRPDRWVPRYTEDSTMLWEQRSAEYVAAVKQNPAAHLDQPEVAAYAAKLDSICAAAQARAKKETRAIPQQNQPAITETRQRVMRETMPKLGALSLPEAVRWPYKGRAFPLMEKYYGYPRNVQPPESLAHQIQQIPGLSKCTFSV